MMTMDGATEHRRFVSGLFFLYHEEEIIWTLFRRNWIATWMQDSQFF